MANAKTYDAAVVGAGVFGAWTAWHLARAGKKVVLLDAYGPANARASSGGESRIIRAGYGPDALYTRWAMRSLGLWKEFFTRTGTNLFRDCGVLWLARERDIYVKQTAETLASLNVPAERLEASELRRRFPQFNLAGVDWGLFERESGVLLARRAVQAVVADAVRLGVEYRSAQVAWLKETGPVEHLGTNHDAKMVRSRYSRINAAQFVFACGPWLGKMFPSVLGRKIFPSRQEVFFFGVPPGDTRFAPPAMPAWIFLGEETYGLPDLESRGFKIALDRHGERVDPDTESRIVSPEAAKHMRAYVAKRFPALRGAPIVETRVCQYENSSSGDFLIDRHPKMENVWLVGGGSGHGFKHGPALGEYLAGRILGSATEELRFSLATKRTVQKRAVY